MPIDCSPAALAKASACYCSPENVQRAETIYLLKRIAGDTSTPAELAKKAACFCFDKKTGESVILKLLCQIANETTPAN